MAKTSDSKKNVTIVQNNRESIIQCQLPGTSGKGGVVLGKLLQLKPGMNFIANEDFEEAMKNATFVALFDTKIPPSKSPETNPERVGQKILVLGVSVSADNPLSNLAENDAIELVDEIFDTKEAKRFLDQETRPRVAKALKEQIHKIDHPEVRKSA